MPHPKREGYSEKLINLKIPAEFGKEIDDLVKNHPELGIRNRTEFVIYVLRKEIQEARKQMLASKSD